MNPYLKNLKKIEFVITYACTGRCKHCSEGDHFACGEHIAPDVAADAVKKIAEAYPIQTVMAFGGEPLLYPESVYPIMQAATDSGIPKRQVITNGYFSKNPTYITKVVEQLCKVGVNDLLLSVDAFHQETIPLEPVVMFAMEAKRVGLPIRTQPAWLVARDADNPYNRKTKELLSEFRVLGIEENEGNIIFPEGNARKYLSEYFSDSVAENPYVEDPFDVRCISFDSNGDVFEENIYETDIMEIIAKYKPST